MSERFTAAEEIAWERHGPSVLKDLERHIGDIGQIAGRVMQSMGLGKADIANAPEDNFLAVCDNVVGQIFILSSNDKIEKSLIQLAIALPTDLKERLPTTYREEDKNVALFVIKAMILGGALK